MEEGTRVSIDVCKSNIMRNGILEVEGVPPCLENEDYYKIQ
jgi:hypothetical protein